MNERHVGWQSKDWEGAWALDVPPSGHLGPQASGLIPFGGPFGWEALLLPPRSPAYPTLMPALLTVCLECASPSSPSDHCDHNGALCPDHDVWGRAPPH